MITGDNAVIYSYVMWLIGRNRYQVPHDRLLHLIAKWFFMAHTTSRYSGPFETIVERDLAQISEDVKDADGFCEFLEAIIDSSLTGDYWSVTLPNDLGTSANKSPALSAYIAALNILDADALLSGVKVRTRLDPSLVAAKGIERRHVFPKEFLTREREVKDHRQVNQIANMAIVDWPNDANLSDRDPAQYWPHQVEASGLPESVLRRQMYWHALPEGWTGLPYSDFLIQRRRLMAAVVRDGFTQLANAEYQANYPEPAAPIAEPLGDVLMDVRDLLDTGHLSVGDVLFNSDDGVEALVLEDGRIDFDDELYETPSAAAMAASGGKPNGLVYWRVEVPEEGSRSLRDFVVEALRGWDEIDLDLLTDPAVRDLIQGMRVAGAPVPQYGRDQVAGWEAELGWPSRKVAVLSGSGLWSAQRQAAFDEAGWHAKQAADWTIVDLIHVLDRQAH